MEIQTVTLSTDEAAEIYYTTDGSEPTTASVHYTSPMEIGEDTTLKIIAIDAVGNQSGVVTETYVIGDLVTDTDEDGWANCHDLCPDVARRQDRSTPVSRP